LCFPKREVFYDLLEQRNANIRPIFDLLIIGQSNFIRHNKVCKFLGDLLDFVAYLGVDQVENQLVFAMVVLGCIVDLWQFGDVEQICVLAIEILQQFAPPLLHQEDVLACAG
jgi:hypothetical protein